MEIKDIVSIAISVLALGISSVGIIVYFRDKVKRTVDAYIDLQEHLFFLYMYDNNEIETFVYNRDSEEYKTLGACLARIEIFSVGIEGRIYDKNVVYKLSHGYIDQKLRNRIEYLIRQRGEENYAATIRLFKMMDKKTKHRACR